MDAMITEPFNCLTDCLILCVRNCLAIIRSAPSARTFSARVPSARPLQLGSPSSDRNPSTWPLRILGSASSRSATSARTPRLAHPPIAFPGGTPSAWAPSAWAPSHRPPSTRSPGSAHSAQPHPALPGQLLPLRRHRFALSCAPPLVLKARRPSTTASSTHGLSCVRPLGSATRSCALPMVLEARGRCHFGASASHALGRSAWPLSPTHSAARPPRLGPLRLGHPRTAIVRSEPLGLAPSHRPLRSVWPFSVWPLSTLVGALPLQCSAA
jgi:hypothetical protein